MFSGRYSNCALSLCLALTAGFSGMASAATPEDAQLDAALQAAGFTGKINRS